MADLKEMMDMADADLDQGTEVVNQLKAEIDRMLKGVKEVTPEEKQIMDSIQEALKEHDLKFSYDSGISKHVDLDFGMENKPFRMNIIIQNGKIIYRLSFPFRVQSNAIPFVTMYMAKFNSDKAFSNMCLDLDDGELTMEYSFILEDPNRFDKKEFWIYMMSLIHPSLEVYTKMAHLSLGMVSGKERTLYKILLEKALETLKGEYDDDDVSYGIEDLNTELSEGNSILKKNAENDDDDNGFFAELLRRNHSVRERCIPSSEEFMRMKEQSEESSEEESEDQPMKASGMLSMFAKRDEDKDSKVVGGDKDE